MAAQRNDFGCMWESSQTKNPEHAQLQDQERLADHDQPSDRQKRTTVGAGYDFPIGNTRHFAGSNNFLGRNWFCTSLKFQQAPQ
jgi:hypothetical protein